MPRLRASCSEDREVGTPRTGNPSRTRAPSSLMNSVEARPDPSPTTSPGAIMSREPAQNVTEEMKMAAAKGTASVVSDDELNEEYIIPSVFNANVCGAVSRAVAE